MALKQYAWQQATGLAKDIVQQLEISKSTPGLAVLHVADQAVLQGSVDRILAAGFEVQTETPNELRMVKPKRMGRKEIAMLLLAFFCCIVPGIMYFVAWSSQPTPVVIVRLRGHAADARTVGS